jgi:hypothetical protein
MKLYPLQPLVFITAYVFVAVSIFLDQPATAITGLAVLASFMVLYFLTRKRMAALQQVSAGGEGQEANKKGSA